MSSILKMFAVNHLTAEEAQFGPYEAYITAVSPYVPRDLVDLNSTVDIKAKNHQIIERSEDPVTRAGLSYASIQAELGDGAGIGEETNTFPTFMAKFVKLSDHNQKIVLERLDLEKSKLEHMPEAERRNVSLREITNNLLSETVLMQDDVPGQRQQGQTPPAMPDPSRIQAPPPQKKDEQTAAERLGLSAEAAAQLFKVSIGMQGVVAAEVPEITSPSNERRGGGKFIG